MVPTPPSLNTPECPHLTTFLLLKILLPKLYNSVVLYKLNELVFPHDGKGKSIVFKALQSILRGSARLGPEVL